MLITVLLSSQFVVENPDSRKQIIQILGKLRPEVMFMELISRKGWNEFHYFYNEYKEKYMNDFDWNNFQILQDLSLMI